MDLNRLIVGNCVATLAFLVASNLAFSQELWVSEVVGPSGSGTRKINIKLSENGMVHLAHSGCTAGDCGHGTMAYSWRDPSSGTWTTETVDQNEGKTGFISSMEIRPDGGIHLLFADQTQQQRRHAYRPADSLEWELTEFEGFGGWWNSSAQSQDRLFWANMRFADYSQYFQSWLEVGTYHDGRWNFEVLDRSRKAGSMTAMTINPWGLPTVTYITEGYPIGVLKLAVKKPKVGWMIEPISTHSTKSALAYDSKGFIHIVYEKDDPLYGGQVWDLWYATDAPDGKLKHMMIDGGSPEYADTGGHPQIAIDGRDQVHISYKDYARDKALKYGRLLGGAWRLDYIYEDRSAAGGTYSGIAIDKIGGVHIVHETSGYPTMINYMYCKDCAAAF